MDILSSKLKLSASGDDLQDLPQILLVSREDESDSFKNKLLRGGELNILWGLPCFLLGGDSSVGEEDLGIKISFDKEGFGELNIRTFLGLPRLFRMGGENNLIVFFRRPIDCLTWSASFSFSGSG